VHPGSTGGDDLPELLQDDGGAVEVDGENGLRRIGRPRSSQRGRADQLADVATASVASVSCEAAQEASNFSASAVGVPGGAE
jgi:hypothetical protein